MQKILQIFTLRRIAIYFIIIGSVVFVIHFILAISWYRHQGNFKQKEKGYSDQWFWDQERIGQIGDFSAGVVGTLLTFSGTILLILTLNEQIKSQKVQKFENAFFKLIDYQHQIINEIKWKSKNGNDILNKECFKYFWESIFIYEITKENIITTEGILSCFNNNYKGEPDNIFGNYFTNLYYIFKTIDKAEIETTEKKDYFNIACAQASDYEIKILFFIGLSLEEKFKRFISKYALYDSIKNEKIIQNLINQY